MAPKLIHFGKGEAMDFKVALSPYQIIEEEGKESS